MGTPGTYVLVHGASHGGWCWRRVSDRLAAAGHRVFCPTLTGLGERAHLLDRNVNLDTHFGDVVGLIEAEELTDVVLVGHSYGGIVITGVAARIPERIRQLVYLDSALVEDGHSWSETLPAELAAARRKTAAESSGGLSVPAPKPQFYGVTDPDDCAWLERRMTPQPFAAFDQKMHWGGPIGNGLSKVYIDCTDPAFAGFTAMKAHYRSRPDWTFIELATGHDAMVSAPEELTRMLLGWAAE